MSRPCSLLTLESVSKAQGFGDPALNGEVTHAALMKGLLASHLSEG